MWSTMASAKTRRHRGSLIISREKARSSRTFPERCSHHGGPEDMPAQDAEEPATRGNFQHKILPARQAIDKCLAG